MALTFIDRDTLLAAADVAGAADALEAALLGGLDPEADAPRLTAAAGAGQLLVMPAAGTRYVTVKLVTVGGNPWIQGVCVAFDTRTLSPVALLDATALTELRTPAVSLLAARRLVRRTARVVVFGRGPQSQAHAAALRRAFTPAAVSVVGSDAGAAAVAEQVAAADIICCATTAREPLFDGALVADHALVIAVGSHEPSARELDGPLMRRSTVVVESRASAMREAGDVVLAAVPAGELVTLRELIAGGAVTDAQPRVFKSTGMSWEDNVVASMVLAAVARDR